MNKLRKATGIAKGRPATEFYKLQTYLQQEMTSPGLKAKCDKSATGGQTMTHRGYSRLFGGDAAKQRAELYAIEHGVNAKVFELGTREAPFAAFGLDPWGRAPDGIIYSYVTIDQPLVRHEIGHCRSA
jgi:hypothetical protein